MTGSKDAGEDVDGVDRSDDAERRRVGEAPPGPRAELSHVTPDDADGSGRRAVMVDVSDKTPGARAATARARVRFPAGVLERVLAAGGPKGPVIEVARVAGIAAAKRTAELVPLCHPIALDWVDVTVERVGDDVLELRCTARCTRSTGVEMEALTGVSLAALTVYDMTKALDPSIAIERVELVEKIGGTRGHWRADGTSGERS